jgi:hemoglobin-like flavoprotein
MEDFLQRRKKMSKQMTPADIELIQQSFARLVPISDKAAALFYDRLFEVAPEVKPLFRGDMTGQGRKLMATLALVVNGLNKLDAILPAASVLAKRHVGYGVKAVHYAAVGAALLWTFEKGLGPSWTPELAAAWTLAYATLSGFMIGEAYGQASVHGERERAVSAIGTIVTGSSSSRVTRDGSPMAAQ